MHSLIMYILYHTPIYSKDVICSYTIWQRIVGQTNDGQLTYRFAVVVRWTRICIKHHYFHQSQEPFILEGDWKSIDKQHRTNQRLEDSK